MPRRLALLAVTLLAAVVPPHPAGAIDLARDWRFVRSMLFGDGEAGALRTVQRWPPPGPTVAFLGARRSDTEAFDVVVHTLNMILAPSGHRITVDTKGFDIAVIAGPWEDYTLFRAAADCGAGVHLSGIACPKADDTGRITRALVIVDSEWHPEELRATLMEEMVHALGIYHHTTEESTSLLYNPPEGRPALQRVSRLDAQLLLFLYTYLRPGDDEATVRAVFDRYWAGMVLPPLSGPLVRGDLDPL